MMTTYTTADIRRSLAQKDYQTLLLPGHPEKKVINLAQVVYISGYGNYVIFHLISGTQITVAYTLASYGSLPGFLRIHKGHSINISYVASLKAKGRNDVWLYLTNGVQLQVSRRRVGAVLDELSSKVAVTA